MKPGDTFELKTQLGCTIKGTVTSFTPAPQLKYHIGQRFIVKGYPGTYLLCCLGPNSAGLVNLDRGSYLAAPIRVMNSAHITADEFCLIRGHSEATLVSEGNVLP